MNTAIKCLFNQNTYTTIFFASKYSLLIWHIVEIQGLLLDLSIVQPLNTIFYPVTT